MILGGTPFALPVIRAAHALGCRAITCDYLPGNPAHRYSDGYCNVDISDADATLAAARAIGADGITSFACDPGVVTAARVAEALGLPSCGPAESVALLQDKGRFRRFLAEHGFDVPPSGVYRSPEAAVAEAGRFGWPVIVKPVDSAGSKGVGRADGPGELASRVTAALARSRRGEAIVEAFIPARGHPSSGECFSVDGRLAFASFSNQFFDPAAPNPYAPVGSSWPSDLPDGVTGALAGEVQRLLTLLGMGTSLYNVETRLGEDGRGYIMECSPRGGGNRLAECVERATGVPLVESAVRAALGLPVTGVAQRPFVGHWATAVLHARRPGAFRELWIDPCLRDAVVERDLWVAPGAPVGGFAGSGDAVGTLLLRFGDRETMRRAMEDIGSLVQVRVQPPSGTARRDME